MSTNSREEIIKTKNYLKIIIKDSYYEIIMLRKPFAIYPNGFTESVLSKGKLVKSFIDNDSVLLQVEGENSYIYESVKFNPPLEIVEFKNPKKDGKSYPYAIDTDGNLYLFE